MALKETYAALLALADENGKLEIDTDEAIKLIDNIKRLEKMIPNFTNDFIRSMITDNKIAEALIAKLDSEKLV